MQKSKLIKAAGFFLGLLLVVPVMAETEKELQERAQGIHERVMTLDTHVDIPFNFSTSEHMPANADAQVNLQNMLAGGLDAAFFIVYVGQSLRNADTYLTAKADAITKFEAIHRMTDVLHPDKIELAYTAKDVGRIHAAGKLVALIGIENGFVIGKDLALLADFRLRGARYMTLVHNGHNDIGDSAQPRAEHGDMEEEHGGLSEFGFKVVDELNRLGILVDISHVSKATMLDATNRSKAPVIASHSSVTSLTDHPRNLDDQQLLAIKENGGVVQIVAFNPYLKMAPPANVSDLVNHIDYAVNLIGIEHVGISSDFGGGGGIEGWNSAMDTFNVTLELVRRGYSEEEITLIWGENVLRILSQAENVSAELGY